MDPFEHFGSNSSNVNTFCGIFAMIYFLVKNIINRKKWQGVFEVFDLQKFEIFHTVVKNRKKLAPVLKHGVETIGPEPFSFSTLVSDLTIVF